MRQLQGAGRTGSAFLGIMKHDKTGVTSKVMQSSQYPQVLQRKAMPCGTSVVCWEGVLLERCGWTERVAPRGTLGRRDLNEIQKGKLGAQKTNFFEGSS